MMTLTNWSTAYYVNYSWRYADIKPLFPFCISYHAGKKNIGVQPNFIIYAKRLLLLPPLLLRAFPTTRERWRGLSRSSCKRFTNCLVEGWKNQGLIERAGVIKISRSLRRRGGWYWNPSREWMTRNCIAEIGEERREEKVMERATTGVLNATLSYRDMVDRTRRSALRRRTRDERI